MIELDSCHLFTPGRASYIATTQDGSFQLRLTQASTNRATTAAEIFDPNYHMHAVFAGGYPGIAQNWPVEHTPPIGNREADLMATPLAARLEAEGWSTDTVKQRLHTQGASNNSIGDVLISVQQGLLDPNDFNRTDKHGVQLVTGGLHGLRFKAILQKALDVDPDRIQRVKMNDPYGTPATEFRKAEAVPVAIAKEVAAIVLTKRILKDVRPGDIDDLAEAEQRFNALVVRSA